MVGKHILVTGKVQGVGFRFFAKAEADLAGLKGWTRNLADGSVEIQVFGEEARVGAYLERLKAGPPSSKVRNLDVSEVEISEGTGHNEFVIRRS
jgi:acylphosphatase